MPVVYHDVLDTARTSRGREKTNPQGMGVAHLHAKGSMVLYALLGYRQRISQTQAFDSTVILDCCCDERAEETDAFFKMVQGGFFQVGLFGHTSLLAAFRKRLDTMTLAAWPEVDDPAEYDEAGNVVRVAGPKRTELIQLMDGKSEGLNLPDSVRANVEAVKRLDAALQCSREKIAAVTAPQKFQLSEWVGNRLNFFRQLEGVSWRVQALKTLDAMKSNDRSLHYRKIEQMDLYEDEKDSLKSVIDIGYNRVVARSLGTPHFVLTTANEKAVRALEHMGEPANHLELITSKAFPGIAKTSFEDLLRFVTDTKVVDSGKREHEAQSAKFLAKVSAEHAYRWTVLPAFSSSMVRLLEGKALESFSTLLGCELPSDLGDQLVEKIEDKWHLQEKAAEKATGFVTTHLEKKYEGVIASVRLQQWHDTNV